LSLTLAVLLNGLATHHNAIKKSLAVCIFLFGSLFNIINTVTQNDFSKQWQVTEHIINTLVDYQSNIPDNSIVNLVNLPTHQSPAPKFRDDFTINGLVSWLFPKRHITGSTLESIDSLFGLPNSFQNPNVTTTFSLINAKNISFIYFNDKLMPLTKLILNKPLNHNAEKGSLSGIVNPVNAIGHTTDYDIATPYIINIPDYDAVLVKIMLLNSKQSLAKHQLRIHATAHENITLPYDIWVSNDSKEWNKAADGSLFTTIIINNASKLKSIALFSDKSEQKTEFKIN